MIMTDYNNPNMNWLPPGYDPYKGMDDDERLKAGCLQAAAFITMLIVGLLLCALFGGCTATERVVTVERHTTDTLRITQYQRDSIYLSDSIYVSDFVRDDTVIKTVERWHTQYRDRWHTDTVYQSKTDSVPVPCPVTEYVERKPSRTERGLMIAGVLSLMAVIVYVANKLKRFLS